jgi:hypothetical protein
MENDKWKMENEPRLLMSLRSIFHFPFSTFHLSSGDQHKPLRTLNSFLKSNPVLAVAALAATVSILSFLYFYANGMTNVYGDGVAHLNIARKVVDSPDAALWRRYIQIGSPWLPLQTVLMLPLIANDWLWRTGVAGSIVSMLSFVIAALSLYLLAREFFSAEEGQWRELLPLLSAGFFVFNPSVLYMQSTPMTELIFMASLVTAVYLLQRWVSEQTTKRLAVAAMAMTVATLTRYEAWPVAALSILVVLLTSSGDWKAKLRNCALVSAIIAIGPIYWLWHNWAIYGNALEFLTGPNSARGIYLQNRANLGWTAMFVGHATLDFLTMVAAAVVNAGPFVLLLSAGGVGCWVIARRRELLKNSPVVLLMVPFFFHVFSLYRGEIQVFPLSAFGLHNVRYGLPHLLAVALFAPAAILLFKNSMRRWAALAACVVVLAQYGYLVSEGASQLAVYQEGYRNGVNSRAAREHSQIAAYLRANPPQQFILMHTGALGPVVSQGGLSFSETIHEGTLRWHQLDDGMPTDIRTVITQQDDPLDLRLRERPALARDLATEFRERVSLGNIRVFVRTEKLKIAN